MGSCKRSQPREPRREGRQKEGAAHGHWGMRNARNDEKRTKSDHVNRIKSNQIKPNPTKKNWEMSNGGEGDVEQERTEETGAKKVDQGFLRSMKPNQTGLARTTLDWGRTGWIRGGCDRTNRKAKGFNDRNTFFIYDTDKRGLGRSEQCSLMFAYVRLCSLNGRKNVEGAGRGHWGLRRVAAAPAEHQFGQQSCHSCGLRHLFHI